MSLEVQGNLYKKFDTQSKTETFQIREFVLKLEGQYPQLIKFQLTQERCDILNTHNEGDSINVHFDLRGREWNGKFLTNLNAWKIDKVAAEVPPAENQAADFPPLADHAVPSSGQSMKAEDFEDDLPF